MIKINNPKGLVSVVLMLLMLFASCQHKSVKIIDKKTNQTSENTIKLSEAQIQLANIKVSQVNNGNFNCNLSFTGVLKVNEENSNIISSRATGRILKLFTKNIGETIYSGEPIYQIYCEELVATERQYFTLQSNNWNYNGKYEPSLALENKLLLLGMLPIQIENLRKNGKILFAVTIYSSVKGIVRSINIAEGQYVNSGQTVFELADDRNLWVEAQVHPEDLDFLKVGMRSVITFSDAGNRSIKSTINFINPSFEQGKNVILIRSLICNANRNLHPGMLAQLQIKSERTQCVMIPASSVITEKNGSLVWIRNEDGSFTRRNITVGLQSDNSVQILSGLNKTDYIVSSGAYLLNSEFILRKGSLADIREKV